MVLRGIAPAPICVATGKLSEARTLVVPELGPLCGCPDCDRALRYLRASMDKINQEQIIVMTGATSGIGASAVKRLTAQPNTKMIVGARGDREISGATVLPLDLSSLESVRGFAEAVKERLGNGKKNALLLNAGAQFRKQQYSVDGFEMTLPSTIYHTTYWRVS